MPANVYTGLSGGVATTNGSLGGGQYTSAGNVGTFSASGTSGLVQKAYDRLIEFSLRTQPLIRSVADKRPVNVTNPGNSVTFQIYKDLARTTGTLSETVDPDAVGFNTPTPISITLNEYGNSVIVTRALNLFSLADVDPAIANMIAYNMADSIDEIAQTELAGGENVLRGGSGVGTTASLAATDVLTSKLVRQTVAKLRSNNAVPRKGQYYWCGIHPEVSYDFRKETDAAGWRTPHNYQSNENIWAGEIGAFEGAFFIETPRLKSAGDGVADSGFGTSGTAAITSIVIADGIATVTFTASQAGKVAVGDFITIASSTGVAGLNAQHQISSFNGSTIAKFITGLTGTVGGTITSTKQTRVFRTFIAGQQALAEAVAEEPHVVIGPVVDKLMRHRPMGWYGVLGFKRFREEALYRIETGSQVNA